MVGISGLDVVNGVITGNAHPTPQVVYATLSKKGAPQEVLEISKVLGTSGVLIAKDEYGKPWIQVQGRNAGRNFPHGGNLGCSPAGLFRYCYSDEGSIEDKITRIKADPESIPAIPVGAEQVAENIKGEAREELGINNKTTLSVQIVGVAHDDTSPHFEILTLVKSTLSVSEINEIAKGKIASLRSANQSELHPHDFTEAFSWIPATPEDLKALILTSPYSPATHIANWIAVGRQLMVQESGERDAQKWQTDVISELSQRVGEVGRVVSTFYEKSPNAFFENLPLVEKNKLEELVLGESRIQKAKLEVDNAEQNGNLTARRIKKYLDRLPLPTDLTLRTALAMLEGVLHVPSDDCFDSRRTPEAQGLLSSVQTFQKIAASGVKVYPGTMGIEG